MFSSTSPILRLLLLALLGGRARFAFAVRGCDSESCRWSMQGKMIRGHYGWAQEDSPPDVFFDVFIASHCTSGTLDGQVDQAHLIHWGPQESYTPDFGNVEFGRSDMSANYFRSSGSEGCLTIKIKDSDGPENIYWEWLQGSMLWQPSDSLHWSIIYGGKNDWSPTLRINRDSDNTEVNWFEMQLKYYVTACDEGYHVYRDTWCRPTLQIADGIPDMTTSEDSGVSVARFTNVFTNILNDFPVSIDHVNHNPEIAAVALLCSDGDHHDAEICTHGGPDDPIAYLSQCIQWSLEGECTANPAYMERCCAGSCGVCRVYVRPQDNMHGQVRVSISGTLHEHTVRDEFSIFVTPVDDPPFISDPSILSVDMYEDSAGAVVHLRSAVTDIDGDAVSFEILSIVDEANTLATALLSGGSLTLVPALHAHGSATITIRATSAPGPSVTMSVAVVVHSVNDDIELVTPDDELVIRAAEDCGTLQTDASNFFRDVDAEDTVTLEVRSWSPVELISSAIIVHSHVVSIEIASESHGSGLVEIAGVSSDGSEIFHTIRVIIDVVDDPPTVSRYVEDVVASEDTGIFYVDLSGVFTDVDSETITIEVECIGMDLTCTYDAASAQLAIESAPNAHGEADVTLTATADNKIAHDYFTITINSVDDPPTVSSTIAPITLQEDANEPVVVSLEGVFTDVDNPSETMILSIVPGAWTGLVQADVLDNRSLRVQTHEVHRHGSATIEIMATSGFQSVSAFVNVLVVSVNDAIRVNRTLANLVVDEDAADVVVSLHRVFEDVDDAVSSIVVASNSNAAVLDAVVSGDNNLILSFVPDAFGDAVLVLEATSADGSSVSLEMDVVVNAIDDAPIVLQPIADMTLNEDATIPTIDLHGVFFDVDSALEVFVVGITNPSLVSATIENFELHTVLVPDASGASVLTLRAVSAGQMVETSFAIAVAPVDDAPILVSPVPDVTIDEDGETVAVVLAGRFTDVDSSTFNVHVHDIPSFVNIEVVDEILYITPKPNQHGIANMTIHATSNGKVASTTFTVTVNAVNDVIRVKTPLVTLFVDEDSADAFVSLHQVFEDVDGNVSNIVVASNSNAAVLDAIVSGDNNLVLSFVPDAFGDAVLVLEATSTDGSSVSLEMDVVVNAIDDAPIVLQPIADMTLNEDATIRTIDLHGVFFDVDSALEVFVVGITNPSLVSATIENFELHTVLVPDASGASVLTLRAVSAGQTVETSFTLTVVPVNDPIHVVRHFEDFRVLEDEGHDVVINVSNLFADRDDATLHVGVADIQMSPPGILREEFVASNESVLLSLLPDANGEVLVTIHSETVDTDVAFTSFVVNVRPVDDAPRINRTVERAIRDEITSEGPLECVGETMCSWTHSVANLMYDIDSEMTWSVECTNANSAHIDASQVLNVTWQEPTKSDSPTVITCSVLCKADGKEASVPIEMRLRFPAAGESSEFAFTSKGGAIAGGVGAALVLLLGAFAVVLCFRMRRKERRMNRLVKRAEAELTSMAQREWLDEMCEMGGGPPGFETPRHLQEGRQVTAGSDNGKSGLVERLRADNARLKREAESAEQRRESAERQTSRRGLISSPPGIIMGNANGVSSGRLGEAVQVRTPVGPFTPRAGLSREPSFIVSEASINEL